VDWMRWSRVKVNVASEGNKESEKKKGVSVAVSMGGRSGGKMP
jgi:hypothetical protein